MSWNGSAAGGSAGGGIGSNGFVTAGTGFTQSFDGLRGGEERRGLDIGYSAATGKGHGDGCGGNGVWHFGDGENIEGAEGEEGRVDLAAKFFDGSANGFETVLGVLHEAGPGFLGVADLMTEKWHGELLCW